MWKLTRHLLIGSSQCSARPSLYCNFPRNLSSSKNSDGSNDKQEIDLITKDKQISDDAKSENAPVKASSDSNEVKSESSSSSVSSKEDDDSKYIIIGPDGIPYDPRKDPEYTQDLIEYKYPQYFTKHLGFKRVAKIIKNDIEIMKKGRIHMIREELGTPNEVDVAIFGGGIIGASVAYFLQNKAPFSYRVGLFERDPTYTRASTTLSAGGIRQQWSHPENVLMSMFTADFLRNAKRNLSILDAEPPDVSFTPQGFLTLASTIEQAERMVDNHKLQIELGAMVELYTPERIKRNFPHINTEGVLLGSYGVQNEGWFDPWALLLSLRAKAQCLGVEMVHADVIDFNFRARHDMFHSESGERLTTCNHVILREPDGNVKHCQFGLGVICCGPESGEIARKLGYGSGRGALSIDFPVEPRKRYVYVFNNKDGPGLDFPFLINSTGDYCRREGLGGNFICGRSPDPADEPDVDNLDMDYNYFANSVHPLLAHRVPAFQNVKLQGGWAGFYDYNRLDQNPIIGQDPYYQNLFWATGFEGHGLQVGPAVGRAIMEQIVYEEYKTIDLSRYGWDRVLQNRPIEREMYA